MTARPDPSSLRVAVDAGLCMGAQRCTYLVPEVFAIGSDGTAVASDPEPAAAERVMEAAFACPNGAISVWHDGALIAGAE